MIDAPIAAGALLVLALLWYIFLRGGNGGCTAHHFENYRTTLSFRAKADVPRQRSPLRRYDYKILVQRKHKAQCEHTGCASKDYEWRTVEELERDL